MAINNAAKMAQADKQPRARKATKKATKKAAKKTTTKKATKKAVPLSGHEDRSATLRIYVKDKDLVKRAKMAALEDETSLSQLWEEWVTDWLETR